MNTTARSNLPEQEQVQRRKRRGGIEGKEDGMEMKAGEMKPKSRNFSRRFSIPGCLGGRSS
jgi:ribosomal protein L10